MASLQLLFKTSTLPAVFLLFAILAFTIRTGEGIMCWECNSYYDKNCADPFRNNTFDPTDCDMRSLDHFPKNKKATVCRKIIQKVKDDYRLVRGCGWLTSEKESTDCIKRAGTFNVLVQYCSCDSDGCNGSESTFRGSRLWALAILLPALTYIGSIAVE